MSEALVSILIPCYNAAPYLRATLDSALGQKYGRKEIIVVDDGSSDGSLQIAQTYSSRGVTVASQINRGASAARNHALKLAHGDWIQFLDADDLLHPAKIAHQISRLSTESSTVVATARWARFHSDPTNSTAPDSNPLFADHSPSNYLRLYASQDCMMHPAAWLVPRTLADKAGPWNENLSLNDDGEYFTRIVAAASAVAHEPQALSYYRSGLPNSLSGQRTRRHLESAHLAATLIAEHLLELDPNPTGQTAAANILQRYAYDYYPAAPDLVADAERRSRAAGTHTVAPLGGRLFQSAKRILGWKLARRLQVAVGRFQTGPR